MASHPLKHSKSTDQQPPRIRRSRSTLTYSTSSFLSSLSSFPSSSPSPFQTTPFHPSMSAIPFSWEHTPGIPRTPLHKSLNSPSLLLLPPPPLRSNSSHHAHVEDPFAAAKAECAKSSPLPEEVLEMWEKKRRRRRIGFGFLDLYGSCGSSCAVSEPAIEIPRTRREVWGVPGTERAGRVTVSGFRLR